LILTLGEVQRAVTFGRQSVELADRSGDAFQRISKRPTLADALHQAARWEDSAEVFGEAEEIQAELQEKYPRLYSLLGYRYCDLLLCWDVRERASETIKIAEKSQRLFDIALDHLTLGRAHLGLALAAPNQATPGEEAEVELARSAQHLDRALDGLRQQAGKEEFVARSLLARAVFQRLRGDPANAAADLADALEIAERCSMRLHVCDAHLEWARLYRQQGDADAARGHLSVARRLVDEMRYRRREREVRWLEKKLSEAAVTPGDKPSATHSPP
jgi:tetratricopeptide (TPR) repeat protein